MRNAFIEELVIAARENPQIALIVGDLGYSVIEPFADEFPDRFINAGVAEQNMTGLAAGLASEGYHVFTYSIANFPTFRCAEQIRNDVDFHKLPVTIVSVGGGLTYGALGYSHHAVQDYALMRSFPNMLIAAPGDPMETRACMRYLIKHPQPSYLRLAKAGESSFHINVPEVEPGVWLPVVTRRNQEKSGKTLLSTGGALAIAMQWRETNQFSDYAIASVPLWSQAVKAKQAAQISVAQRVVTMEDHLQDGGFGAWLLESVANEGGLSERIRIRGLDSLVCGTVGTQTALNTLGGLGRFPDKI
jgi:transketolase